MRKATKEMSERRRYPVGYDWKREKRIARLRERIEAAALDSVQTPPKTERGGETDGE